MSQDNNEWPDAPIAVASPSVVAATTQPSADEWPDDPSVSGASSAPQEEQWPDDPAVVNAQKFQEHQEVAQSVATRTQALGDMAGQHVDDFDAQVAGHDAATKVTGYTPSPEDIAQQQKVDEYFNRQMELKHGHDVAVREGMIPPDKFDTAIGNKVDYVAGQIAIPLAEGVERGAVEGVTKTAAMVVRLSNLPSDIGADLGGKILGASDAQKQKARDYLSFGSDEVVPLLTKFNDYLDQNAFPEETTAQGFVAKTSGMLGEMAPLLMSGGILGRAGTAAFLALQNGESVADRVAAKYVQDGGDQSASQVVGAISAAATLPLSYGLNLYNPIAKVANEARIGIPESALQMVGIGMGQRAVNEAAVDPRSVLTSAYYQTVFSKESAALDAIGGSVVGGISQIERSGLENQVRDKGVLPDVLNKSDLQTVLQDRLQLSDDTGLQVATKLIDSVYQQQASKLGVPVEAIYAQSLTNESDRGAPGEVLFQEKNDLAGFYSKLNNAVQDPKYLQSFGDKPANVSDIYSYLKNQGVKADELKWSGIQSLVEQASQQPDPVKMTKDEMLGYLDKNQAKVVMVVKGDSQQFLENKQQLNDLYAQGHELETKRQAAIQSNDLESVANLTSQQLQIQNQMDQLQSQVDYSSQSRYSSVTAPGPAANYEEWLMRMPLPTETATAEQFSKMSYDQKANVGQEQTKFSSSHWDEPNVLVHIRVDQRASDQGPVLFVNEIQSDWNQEGKAEGYQDNEQLQQLTDAKDKLGDQITEIIKQQRVVINDDDAFTALSEQKTKLRSEYVSLEKQISDQGHMVEPNPFQKSWTDLALKKILLEAVNRNIPRVAFASGELQDRFQGVVDEEQSKGRREFYDKIVPNKLGDIVRKLGVKQGMEVVNVQTSNNAAVNDMGQLNRQSFEPVLSLPITDELRSKLFSDGLPLYQDQRGSVRFLANGKALIDGLNSPDFSTAVHEFAHVFLRQFVSDADLGTVQNFTGAKDGLMLPKNEEIFARAFERYVRTGQAPSGDLVQTFQDAQEIMKGIYKTADSLGQLPPVSHEIHAIFDRLFIADNDPIEAKRREVVAAQDRLDSIDAKQSDPSSMIEKAQARTTLAKLTSDLQNLKENNFNPRQPTRPELMAIQAQSLFKDFVEGTPEQWSVLRESAKAFHSVDAFLRERASELQTNEVGRAFVEWMQNASHDRLQQKMKLMQAHDSGLNALSDLDSERLSKLDPVTWQHGSRSLLDEVGAVNKSTPDTPGLQSFTDLGRRVFDYATESSVKNNILRQLPSGDTAPTVANDQLEMPRLTTAFGRQLFAGRTGELGLRYVQKVIDLNPDLKLTPDQVFKELSKYGKESQPKMGSLEGSRTIRYLPDGVIDNNGKQFDVFHGKPTDLMNRWIDKTTSRIASVKYLGQGMLENVADPKGPGFYQRFANLVEIFGKTPSYDKIRLQEQLLDQGWTWESLKNLSHKDLRDYNSGQQLPTKPTLDELQAITKGLSVTDLQALSKPETRIKDLRNLATDIGGIDSKADPQVVLENIRHRMRTQVEDNLLDLWKKKYQSQGGDPAKIDKFMSVWHGAMGDSYDLTNPLVRGVDVSRNLVGTLATSLSTVKHVLQLVRLGMPTVRGVVDVPEHLFNTVKAYGNMIFNSEDVQSQLKAQEVVSNWAYSQKSETGYGMVDLARNIRSAVAGGTLQKFFSRLNEGVSFQLGRGLAEDWKSGFQKKDVGLANRLDLNSGEVELLLKNSGQMPDYLYKKIITNYNAKMLGGDYELPQHRAIVETNPWTKAFLGWQRYPSLALRNFVDTMAELRPAIKSKNLDQIQGSGTRIMAMLGAVTGAGLLTNMILNRAKALPPEPSNETWWDKVTGAGIEQMLFGMPTSLLNGMKFSGQSSERFVLGYAPQLEAITQLVGTIMKVGKYGQMPLGTRVAKGLENITPAAKAADTAITNNMYPSVAEYEFTRSRYFNWQSKQPGYVASSDQTPLNPEYQPIFQDIQQGDMASASQDMNQYFRKAIGEDHKTFTVAASELKLSLMGRRPLPMADTRMYQFLSTLPDEERSRVLGTNYRYTGMVNALVPSGSKK